ncbi:flap endonuclease 1 [Prionailurus iriomotensis]|uniref:exonuclease 1 n=1 Tax=Prionailurus bengalensis TaxID=37029 RepID=UPI001CA98C3D|nr:exonuclease 1 [Prionailurus bengalensis]
MGIQGLLQFIKEASEPIHVRKYKGQVVAVDTYCWLHKGAIACAEKLAKGEPTDKYVGFCMKFVNMLLSHGIKPILVFDGCTLPSKKEVEKSRRERRQANLLKGKQLLREGKVSEARECFTRSINITHVMAHKVIKAARSQGVDCLVAPYEADAQLAYLNKAGIVQAIITEDSDLLAFGCKKVILKMDQFGNGLEIDQARLGMCRQLGDVFTEEKFRYMCILSGCDYLSSLRGIGLAKACKVLRLANNPDIVKVIKKIGHYLKMNITVPEDYIKGFIRANNTFLYQLVFDPIKRKLIPLNAYEDDIDPETLSYAGQYFDDSIALQIALGNKDINTFEQIDNYNPDIATPAQSRSHSWNDKTCQKSSNVTSIWHRNYCPRLELNIASDAVRLKESPSTVGIEQVISVKGLNLPRKSSIVKRPRSEELSEDDLLSQYSLSFTKKTKKSNCEAHKSLNSEMLMPDLVDGTTVKKNISAPPTTRNKFAAFLQRKNEESGAVVVPGTRSRFFCSSLDSANCVSAKAGGEPPEKSAVTDEEASVAEPDRQDGKKLAGPDGAHNSDDEVPDESSIADEETSVAEPDREDGKKLAGPDGAYNSDDEVPDESSIADEETSVDKSDCQDGKKLAGPDGAYNSGDQVPDSATMIADDTLCLETSEFTRTISPPTLGTLRNCFSWSGSLGDFSRTSSPSPGAALQQFRRRTDPLTVAPDQREASAVSQLKSEESGDGAPPVRAAAWCPKSQGSPELSPHNLNVSKLSQPSSKDSDSEESDCNNKSFEDQGNLKSKLHLSQYSRKVTLLKNKIPGLYKSSSVDNLSATRIKPLVPARASGLSKKPSNIQKRNHHNAENRPGLQIKINELWKNFGFKKDFEKLPSCKKPDPLSPVKDNIQLTPEAEEDIFNKSECMRVQRAIFQ